jgi:hypothetical protein
LILTSNCPFSTFPPLLKISADNPSGDFRAKFDLFVGQKGAGGEDIIFKLLRPNYKRVNRHLAAPVSCAAVGQAALALAAPVKEYCASGKYHNNGPNSVNFPVTHIVVLLNLSVLVWFLKTALQDEGMLSPR